jgi:hypothetical protein
VRSKQDSMDILRPKLQACDQRILAMDIMKDAAAAVQVQ